MAKQNKSIKLMAEIQQELARLHSRLFFAMNMYKLENYSANVEGNILNDFEDMTKATNTLEEAEILLGEIVARNNVLAESAKEAGAV